MDPGQEARQPAELDGDVDHADEAAVEDKLARDVDAGLLPAGKSRRLGPNRTILANRLAIPLLILDRIGRGLIGAVDEVRLPGSGI
jgi:hypothetical protein